VLAALYPQEDSWYSFPSEAESTQSHSAAGRIRSIEKSNDLIGDKTRDLSACSIVPQPTMVPGAPNIVYNQSNYTSVTYFVFSIHFCIKALALFLPKLLIVMGHKGTVKPSFMPLLPQEKKVCILKSNCK
jgi:hypothetical protein